MNHCAATIPDLFFVQIGANYGVIYDPLYHYVRRYRWPGLLVEPARCYFARLQENYRGHPNLIFENAAVSDRDEQRALFRIREDCDYLPQWCSGLGSFHREVLLSHRWAIPDLERYVVEEIVHCVTLRTLLRKHAVTRVDILSIDTEGHDHEILRQIDFESVCPRAVIYEHEYIGREDRKRCEAMLASRGYALSRRLGDTLAYLPF